MTERFSVSALATDRRVARAERCGYEHLFGRRPDSVGYYDRHIHGGLSVRTFVCERHARQVERETHTVVRNGGVWPEGE